MGATAQAFPARKPRALRILVVDDSRDAVLSAMMLLEDEGHEVRALYSGRDVVKVVQEFNPDAVLLDIALPGVSGWEVARELREKLGRRHLLVGISGEYKHSVDRILSEAIGFDHYLVKPYDPNELLALLAPLSFRN
jgi:two-component system, OmpR family, response regulator